VQAILSASAVGSLKEELKPLDIVVPDQFIDRTRGRISTFFGRGIVVHVGFAHPICGTLAKVAGDAGEKVGATVHRGGTYVCMEGPQFSTLAESRLYRSWGADIIGMTNLTEARLAREAEICYASLALVTDYDCWREATEDVTVETILTVLADNAAAARRSLAETVARVDPARRCGCRDAMRFGMITDRAAISPAARKRLGPIVGRYL